MTTKQLNLINLNSNRASRISSLNPWRKEINMKKSLCEQCYHQDNCPVDPNYKAERAPAIITTCTDYDPKQEKGINMNNYVQCQNCQYYLSGTCAYYEQPLDHYPDEDITCTDYEPEYEPPYREPFGNDDCDVPYVNYVQEPEPDDDYELDYYEQGTQCFPIDEFTGALLDWLETPKSK